MSRTLNNAICGRLATVYSHVIQLELMYMCPAQVVCTYKPVRQVHYISRTLNNAIDGRLATVYSHVIQLELMYMVTCPSGL